MEMFLPYILKVNIALALFYVLYAVLLKKDTFIKMRRYFFLSAILFSFAYPLFTVSALANIGLFQHYYAIPKNADIVVETPNMQVIADGAATHPFLNINPVQLLVWLIVGVTAVLALRFLWQLACILRIRFRSKKAVVSNVWVYDFSENSIPFSFFGWIFLNHRVHSDEELRQIILHEQIHVRQWHSVDIVLAELLCVFYWWNPALWLMKREIAINLEYLADKGVLREGVNSKEYQYHLLRLTYPETAVQIVNNFNVSQLKQRIMMMNKTKTPASKLAKYLMILPLAFALVTANSCINKEKKSEEGATEKTPDEVVISPDTIPVEHPDVAAANEEVFVVVEKQPEFPGGTSAMMKYIGNAVQYPAIAHENGIEGRVVCNFVVEKDGSITDVQVVRGVDPSLDKEAVRVIQSMPKWNSGTHKGDAVRVRFTLPVVFRLQGAAKKAGKTGYPPPPPPPPSRPEKESGSDEVFVVVEKQPEFPGGVSAMMRYLSETIKYPLEAQEKKIQGRVTCNFIIQKDGSISEVRIIHGVDPLLDKEAVRVIEAMPKWKPGMQRGQEVVVRYTLPVVFKLQK